MLLGEDSDQQPTLSIVLPTLNEEEGVAKCIEEIKQVIREHGILTEIVISDSSTDDTPEIAREMGAIVVTPEKLGYGYAYQYGFEHVRGRYVAMGDADTTYDFTELPDLLHPVLEGEADLVLGSRFEGEIAPSAMPPLHRYVGNPLLTRFLNSFYGAEVTDAHSGLRVFSRDALEQLELRSEGMEFASEMIMRAAERGLRIREEPITYRERRGEAKLNSFRDGWRHVKFMLVNAPGYLFTGPGLGLVTLGILVNLLVLFSVEADSMTPGVYYLLVGGVSLVLGHQLISLAVFSSLIDKPIRSPSDPVTRWITQNFRLEQGATLGLAMIVGTAAYFASVLTSGTVEQFQPSLLNPSIVAFSIFVLGAQTVFYALFFSMIGQNEV